MPYCILDTDATSSVLAGAAGSAASAGSINSTGFATYMQFYCVSSSTGSAAIYCSTT